MQGKGKDEKSEYAVVTRDVEKAIRACFDLTPSGIIRELDLLKPIYLPTATYGHFGRNEFPWEQLDKVDELRKFI